MAYIANGTIVCSANSPYGASIVASCNSRPAILAAVAERALLRAQQIAEDAATKRAYWEAEFAHYRTPPSPKVKPVESGVTDWINLEPKPVASTPSISTISDVAETPKLETSPAPPTPAPNQQKSATVVSNAVEQQPSYPPPMTGSPAPKAEASVKKKTAMTTPSPARAIDAVSIDTSIQDQTVTAKREEAKKSELDTKATKAVVREKAPSSTKAAKVEKVEKSASTTKATKQAGPVQTKKKSLDPPKSSVKNRSEEASSLRRDAAATSNQETIRSGTGSTGSNDGLKGSSNTTAATPEAPIVIPSNVKDAVQGGKLKGLTVTKLRRMLSECGLKTSGRKSELIARLTSFVRK